MASRMEWHLLVQEEAAWLRLENKVRNIADSYMNAFNKPCSFSTDCLAVSNGVCTKRNTAQFGLLLFENKVSNSSQT